jgi:hypothetical protein
MRQVEPRFPSGYALDVRPYGFEDEETRDAILSFVRIASPPQL